MIAQPATSSSYLTLAKSFFRGLRAANCSARTITIYRESIDQLRQFLLEHGMPTEPSAISREHVEEFIEHLLETRKPATAATRYRGLRRFFGWLVEEGEIQRSPMERMREPKVGESPPPVLTIHDIRKILATSQGKTFLDRRDTAIIRLLFDTGARRSELAGLMIEDVDIDYQMMRVHGKGSRDRDVPFGAKAAADMDRYLRVRRNHRLAGLHQLWLGHKGPLTAFGLYDAVRRRAARAGLEDVFVHQFRHSFAHAFLSGGGQESDLAQLGGWKSAEVMRRYGASVAARRARDAHRRLSPGDRI